MRLRAPSSPLSTQTEPAPAARLSSPVGSASPVAILATTSPVDRSRRQTESSAQLATQSDSSTTTIPPHGPGTSMVATGAAWSAWSSSTRPSLVAQTESPSAARKSTYPGIVSRRDRDVVDRDGGRGHCRRHLGPCCATYSATSGPSCARVHSVTSRSRSLQWRGAPKTDGSRIP